MHACVHLSVSLLDLALSDSRSTCVGDNDEVAALFANIVDRITFEDLNAVWERAQVEKTVSEAVFAIEEKLVRMSSFVRGSPAKVKAAVDKLSASMIEAGAVKTSGIPVPVYGGGNCLFWSVVFSMFSLV